MSRPRFLLDEHVWGGLVEVGRRLGMYHQIRAQYEHYSHTWLSVKHMAI